MKDRGFTLPELMVALVIMAIIMISIGNVTTMMVRQGLQSEVKSEVAGDTVVALDVIQRDVEGATYLCANGGACASPLAATPGNAFGLRFDWSHNMGNLPADTNCAVAGGGCTYDNMAKIELYDLLRGRKPVRQPLAI